MFSRPQFLVVLGGELAVPCTSNPLQLGRIPRRAAMWASKPRGGVEGWVRCNGCLRTPPGSEDSNGKLDVPCAVGCLAGASTAARKPMSFVEARCTAILSV